MSIPAQGAVGAETMTAGIGPRTITTSRQTCAGCPALETKEWTFYGENDDIDSGTDGKCTAVGKVISGYWSERDPTPDWCPALASHRADSDERTAGEDHPNVFRVLHALKGSLDSDVIRQSDGLLVGDLRVLANTATPAQPAGTVPAEVRKALEFYASQWNADCDAVLIGPGANDWSGGSIGYEATEDLSKDAGAQARRALRLLSSHPAGQSAGSGVLPSTETMVATARITRIESQMRKHGGVDSDDLEWMTKGIRAAIKAGVADRQPAPDSTRTGQGEETVAVPASALRWLFGDGPDADGVWFGDQIRGKGAFWWRSEFRKRIEAARPAAPEAQGAWSFDMEAAPRDGTPLLCIEYDEPEKVVDLHWFRDGGTASSWRGSFGQQRRPIAWCRLPAPPASSGQEG